MLKLFQRTPTASQMARMSQEARRKRYREFHDKLAAKVGREIEWAE